MVEIVQKEDPVLHEPAKEVSIADLKAGKLDKLIADMKVAVRSQRDGIAIAAPQIGASLRVFVVNGELLKQADKTFMGDGSDLIFINPKITKLSKEKKEVEEGCLSVRWYFGKVRRSTRATIIAYNEKGEKIERGAKGLLAQIFQHETDHLEGKLFLEKADQIWEMTEEEIREIQGK